MKWRCPAPRVSPLAEQAHEEALRRGDHTYLDPATRQPVFTAAHHLERGYCCGCGCRHCPYPKEKPSLKRAPALAESAAAR